MLGEIYIQEHMIREFVSDKQRILFEPMDEVLDIIYNRHSVLDRRKVIKGLHPDFISVISKLIIVDSNQKDNIWLVDESYSRSRYSKNKISIPGGHVELTSFTDNVPDVDKLLINSLGRELYEEFVGDEFAMPIECMTYNRSDISFELNYLGFTPTSDIFSAKMLYKPHHSISMYYFIEAHPTLEYKRNAVPFSKDELRAVQDIYRNPENVGEKMRAMNYLNSDINKDVRIMHSQRDVMFAIFDYLESIYK